MNGSTAPTLPRNPRSAVVSSSANAGGAGRTAATGHILLVDGDPDIRGVLARLLRGAGYRVDTAADGSAGLIALCFNPYDLLITEHEMPKITGFELLRRARACPLHLPAILISGFMPWDEADLESLIRPGAVLEKPFAFGALLANVRTLLNQGLS